MVRLTRAEQQRRTRAAVLAAATQEFAEHGYLGAKIDRIADRVDLTRGAVYSNFPGKRALYLAVLIDLVEPSAEPAEPDPPADPAVALGAFARVWLERLPLAADSAEQGRLQLRSLTDALDESARAALTQTIRLQSLLLGLGLESVRGRRARRRRRVRQAELALTLLAGAAHLAEAAPGFGDPFAIVQACERLAGVEPDDGWDPPHLDYVEPARPARDRIEAPDGPRDLLTGAQVGVEADGVIIVLGTERLGAAEEAVRAAGPDEQVTIAVVSDDPDERGRLARLMITDLVGGLRRVFPSSCWGGLRLVLDDDQRVATAAGLTAAGDVTEAAVRVLDGMIVARAEGRGAGHAAGSAVVRT
jgi:AcrR family transcriptional regulator